MLRKLFVYQPKHTDFFQRLQDLLLSEMFQQLHRNCVHFCIKFKFR